jgi:porphobilinogen synthase
MYYWKGERMRLTTRTKKSKQLIRLLRPFELTAKDLIYPIFIREDGKNLEISPIKGQFYLSLDNAVKVCTKTLDLGIPAVMVFGVLKVKNADGSIALQNNGFHSKIFNRLKGEFGDDLVLISNVCLCDYTSEEFCVYSENGKVLNKKTAAMLGKIAVVHAEAGADIVAPAAMCDGQVGLIRQALDAAGLDDVSIMSYIKTDSCLFQPFFEAMTLSEHPRHGIDSSKFRSDIINEKVFMQKVDLDVGEGADMIIVKPALTNLDLILRVKQSYPTLPIAAYQVSGEYAMMKLLSEHAHLDENALILETLSSIRRAGADMILTYNAIDAAGLVNSKRNNRRLP